MVNCHILFDCHAKGGNMKSVKMTYVTSYFNETDIVFAHHHMVWGNYPGSRKPYTHGHAFWNYPSGERIRHKNYELANITFGGGHGCDEITTIEGLLEWGNHEH
jgi:hypothetical protein